MVSDTLAGDGSIINSEENKENKYPNLHHFPKGVSGNPGGRPKRSKEEQELWNNVRSLGPLTYASMVSILENPRAQAMAKVKLIEIILSYIIGKPRTEIKLDITQENIQASEIRIAALIQSVKNGGIMENQINSEESEVIESAEPGILEECPASLDITTPDRSGSGIQGSDEYAQHMD